MIMNNSEEEYTLILKTQDSLKMLKFNTLIKLRIPHSSLKMHKLACNSNDNL